MASWNPFGVSLNITAVAAVVTRKSATQFTVKINASWACANSGNKTDYGMKASSGGGSVTLNEQGTKSAGSSGSFTGTYSISGNGGAVKTIAVTFTNFNTWHDDSATKTINISVNVPAWTSYTIAYDANGGSGAPGKQTKWHGENLKISTTQPTRAGYTFKGWALSKTDADNGSWYYQPGATCGKNENLTLYAVWQANTYNVTYNANGGKNAPESQIKTHGKALTLSSAVPTRDDYTFKGWATSATSTTVAYKSGASYTNNATITLFAVWESSYTKPRITNLTIERCNSSGTLQEDGSDVLIKFDYDIDRDETPSISWSWKVSTDISWTGTIALNDADKDNHISTGTFENESWAGTIDPEKTYTWELIVSDSGGSTPITGTVQSLNLAIDVKPPKSHSSGEDAEYGVSVGKAAELRGVFDMGLKAKFGKGYIAEVLAADTDLDTKLTPGWYSGIDGKATTYGHRPEILKSGSFSLEVISAGSSGQLMQRLVTCNKDTPIECVRLYYLKEWGSWRITGGYKPAMSAYLSSNQTTVASSYTKIDFDSAESEPGLTLTTDGGIKIGEGISRVLVSLTVSFSGIKANGNKHIKIMKNSTACAWITGYGASGGDFTLTIPQRVVNVTKNDVISATYYSINADETISAGSSANGWKTCLTVEAI